MAEPRPTVPLLLGIAGLLPFLAAAIWLIITITQGAPAALLLAAYGVAILAFLGGVHWGRGLSGGRAGDFVWSVLPALVGVGVLFLSPPWTLAALSAAFAMAGIYDVVLFRAAGPAWYAQLRIALTLVVVLTLAVASAFAPDVGPLFGLLRLPTTP